MKNAGPAQQAGTVLGIMRRACLAAPRTPALIFEDGIELSRQDLLDASEAFAGYLHERIEPQDCVAIMLGNRAEYFVAWFAVAANRAALVSINPAARGYDAGYILQDSRARILITDAGHASLIAELRADCPYLDTVIELGPSEPYGLAEYKSDQPFSLSDSSASPDDVINIYYTSGTTGPPKGCMLSHHFWLRFVDVFMSQYGVLPTDRLLCWFGFFYVDPPWMVLASLQADTSLVVMRRFSVSRFWRVVNENSVTILFGSASVPLLLLARMATGDERAHSVRYCVHVGIPASAHQALVDRWGFPWYEAYGLTETGLVIAMPPDAGGQMIGTGSIGLPCPGVQVRVADESGSDVPAGSLGELLIQAPGLMVGYLGRPDLDAEAFQGGWFHTGDLVTIDEDQYVYFAGRKKDIIRRSGENIAAAEVEAVLRTHPMVVDAALIPVPDELRGEEAKAYIVLSAADQDTTALPAQLAALCAAQLASYKVPRYWALLTEDLPRTPSMRVKKDELRKQPALVDVIWDRHAAKNLAQSPRETDSE